jgi:hypothetical protein
MKTKYSIIGIRCRFISLAVAASLAVGGCATEVRSRNGRTLLRVPCDVKTLHYASTGGGEATVLDLSDHKPSTTIRATGSAGGTWLTGITAAIAAWYSGGAVQ